MTSRSEKIINFNMILESFLSQTSSIVGTTYHHYFKKLIKINAPLPIKYASEHMLMFRDQIMKRDEVYFNNNEDELKDRFIQSIDTNKLQQDTILDEILKLKDIYYGLDEASRENLWDILQALLQLVIEYNDLDL